VDYSGCQASLYLVSQRLRQCAAAQLAASGTPSALQLTADKTNLVAVDGTDDAQLVVTVVDSKRQRPSTTAFTVTLSITSGPGRVPDRNQHHIHAVRKPAINQTLPFFDGKGRHRIS